MQFLHVQVNDVGADVVQERLVVRNYEQGFLPALQIVVEPDNGVQIQVVGWFVEHQKSGLQVKSPT